MKRDSLIHRQGTTSGGIVILNFSLSGKRMAMDELPASGILPVFSLPLLCLPCACALDSLTTRLKKKTGATTRPVTCYGWTKRKLIGYVGFVLSNTLISRLKSGDSFFKGSAVLNSTEISTGHER